METSVQTFIEMCQWDTSRFLIFSDNVFGTLIYYSHILAFILAIAVGLFVFFNNRKILVNRLLFFIMSSFAAWVFFDLILWANEKPDFIMFFWALILLVEPLIYALSVYFVSVFIEKKDISLKKKIWIFSPLLPIIVLLSTQLTLVGFDLTNCFREPIEGPIATYYIYLIETIYLLWILDFSFRKYRQAGREMKKQVVLITSGVIFFLLSFVSGNIVGSFTENWTLAQVGLFSMPIFVVFLAYMIVKFKTFNIKLIGTQMLIFALGFLVLGMIFIRTIQNVRIVAVATLLLIAVVGYLLIRGVKREVKQREELARLNLELEDLIKQRENLVHLVTHKVKGSFTRSKYIFAEMLDGTFGEISPEIKKRAEQGLESDNMGIETVDLVLSVANMQKGVVKYDMKEIDLKEIIFKTISEKKITVEAKGLKMETEIKPDTYHVSGDAFWLKEVINNLIENSLKYTKEGTITVGLEKTSGKVKFYVKDTGIGITEEDKKNLFTEGGRGKDSVKVNVDSTGYGLYSVKLIVDAHKGRVWAESEGMGKGSQFYVELDAT
ncbi:hypothetical protein A2911_02795 [Candidatus Nomurabacteria bacterium RIFCSPLOWO2_01_FULL_40_15]|uniref:histidine kinase n=1 Tax=Candidatus Nomurabacteria bacterium RIFCSPLOWO2_01_FULL_40_15 TaxID=1801772 RepID=A0A1F6X908_9BACT|nr:MAG: hypothetical protein A2911_02795 [Candidatus Nomurabacteria bacterium RIFCSPLOWO2_01_FULL_40_15]